MSLDPFDCAYVYARGAAELEARKIPIPARSSISSRIAAFLRRAVRRTSLAPSALPKSDVLLYVESSNQMNSLFPVAEKLTEIGCSICLAGASHRQADYGIGAQVYPLAPSVFETIRGLFHGFRAAPRVVSKLKQIPRGQLVLDQLLETYRLSPMFERALSQVEPKVVVVANDHITSCRVLTRLAQGREIKTAYVQHAQVSSIFPPLEFDFAFLDGQCALDIYSDIADRTKTKLPNVFLSGEKKTIRSRRVSREMGTVGICVNPLDKTSAVRNLAKQLHQSGFKSLIFRLHPAMRGAEETELRSALLELSTVKVHLATDVPMQDFVESISFLIAGDSSVHIDILLSHVPSFYFSMTESRMDDAFDDYYGFVSLGLVPPLPEDLEELAACDLVKSYPINIDALKHVSATIGTSWDGNEGLLTAKTLAALIESEDEELEGLYTGYSVFHTGNSCFYP